MCSLQTSAGAGVFELQILELSNYRLELASGACCGGGAPAAAAGAGAGACSRPCRTRFALCLKEYQSVAAPGACSFGRADSPPLGTDSFTLAETDLYTLALPFTFRWTVSVRLLSALVSPPPAPSLTVRLSVRRDPSRWCCKPSTTGSILSPVSVRLAVRERERCEAR